MTVKELIEKLKKLPENMTVITQESVDNYAPSPRVEKYKFRVSYWDGDEQIQIIPENTEFVML